MGRDVKVLLIFGLAFTYPIFFRLKGLNDYHLRKS